MNNTGPRRRGGFLQAGQADLSRIEMPRRRAAELRLHRAWRRAAGQELSGRLRPVRILRGCLELELLDPGWSRAIDTLLPALVDRLAAVDPGLGIRKFRVLGTGREDPEAGRSSRGGTGGENC